MDGYTQHGDGGEWGRTRLDLAQIVRGDRKMGFTKAFTFSIWIRTHGVDDGRYTSPWSNDFFDIIRFFSTTYTTHCTNAFFSYMPSFISTCSFDLLCIPHLPHNAHTHTTTTTHTSRNEDSHTVPYRTPLPPLFSLLQRYPGIPRTVGAFGGDVAP